MALAVGKANSGGRIRIPHRVRDGIGGVENACRDRPDPLIRALSASAGLDWSKNRGVRTVQRQPVACAQGSDTNGTADVFL